MAIVDGLQAGLAARGLGATLLQVRAPALPTRVLESIVGELVVRSGLPVLVSRRVDVALAAGAAGVNLPEGDIPTRGARLLLGVEALIGRSVHDLAGALAAESEGASYVIFGPVFETPTHPGVRGAGLEALAAVAAGASIPVLAVGGVEPSSLAACLEAGAAGHAAIRMYG